MAMDAVAPVINLGIVIDLPPGSEDYSFVSRALGELKKDIILVGRVNNRTGILNFTFSTSSRSSISLGGSVNHFYPNDPVGIETGFTTYFLSTEAKTAADNGWVRFFGPYYSGYFADAVPGQYQLLTVQTQAPSGATSYSFRYEIDVEQKTISPPPPPPPAEFDPTVIEDAVGVTVALVDGAKDVIVEWVRNGGDKLKMLAALGEHVTNTLSGGVMRVGGVLIAFQQGLLEPKVAQGVRAFVEALYDPDDRTRGLLMAPQRRRNLQDALYELDRQRDQIVQPKSTSGGINRFDVPVKPGKPLTIDPPLAAGFEYQAPASGPLFASFALPLLVPGQGSYIVEVYERKRWRKVYDASPLKEYRFAKPTQRFRVLGVPRAARVQTGDPDHRWLTALSFNSKGRFRGSIRSIPSSAPGAFRSP